MALKKASKELRADLRKELEILGLRPRKNRTNPVSSPNELYVKSDYPVESLEVMARSLLHSIMMLKKKSVILYYFALLQFENGIRTAELIGVKSGDITATGSFKLRGKKGSNNRMIAPGEARDYLLECRKNGSVPFGDFDRFYLRREYIKVGIYYLFTGDKKGKVTHVFRHLYVSGMLQSGIEVEEAKKFVGHKNVKSTEHYGKIS